MGFQRSVMKLVWADDTEFAGFEITMKRVSVATSLKADEYDRAVNSVNRTESERNTVIQAMTELIARHVISWNYEDEHENPVVIPYTVQEVNEDTEAGKSKLAARVLVICQIDLPMMQAILRNWIKTATQVNEASPLDSNSPYGPPFPEVNLPMEPLSPSLPN